MALFYIALMIVFGCITASMAAKKNRSGLGWFFVGALFGLIGVLVAHVATPKAPAEGTF